MASLKNIINSDDDQVDPSSETSMQPLPTSDSSGAAATYSTTGSSQPPTPLPNDLIDPARHSSRFFASEPPSSSSSADMLLGRRRSNTSTDSMDTPYDPNYVMPSGSNFLRPIQRNPPTDPQYKLTPITGKVSKAKKGMPVHNCDKCSKTFTRAEHLRRHKVTHGRPDFICDRPNCGKTFYRKDLLDRHLQRHDSDDTVKNEPKGWPGHDPKSPPSRSYVDAPMETSVLQMPQAYTQPEHTNDMTRSTTMAPSTWTPSSSTSHPSPNQPPHQTRPNKTYSSPNEFIFDQTPMTSIPTTSASFPYAEPRTLPELPELYIPVTTWQDSAMPSSASESTYSTPSDNAQPSQFPPQTSSGDWNAPLLTYPAVNETHSPVLNNGSFQVPLAYAASPPQLQMPFGNNLGLWLEEPLFDPEQYQATTVRSLPPQMAVAQSSETLVTLPATIPTPDNFSNGTGCGRPQGLGILDSRREVPVSLSRAARDAIPGYLEVYWEKVHPLYPFVHRATFDRGSEETAEAFDLLRCAMAAVATQYLADKSHRMKGAELHAYAWHKSKVFTQAGEWPRPLQQALLLLQHYSCFRGKKKDSYKPSQRFATLYQRVLSNQNAFIPLPNQPNIMDQWMPWIDMETRRRLLAACFILDVHSARYHERQPTFFSPDCNQLPIPMISDTDRLWDAQSPQDWVQLLAKGKLTTLQDVNLEALTASTVSAAPPFDGAVMLAALAMYLPQRQALEELNRVSDASDIKFDNYTIAQLFPASAVANTYLALHNTPLHALLSVSGDSWVFNEKVPSKKVFSRHKEELGQWQGSGSATVAVGFAARALKAFLGLEYADEGPDGEGTPTQLKSSCSWKDISDYWGVYVCTLICWAFCYTGRRNQGTERVSQETAMRWILTLADMEPSKIQNLPNRNEGHGVVSLSRVELEAQSVGGRNILLLDATRVLKELEQRNNWVWF